MSSTPSPPPEPHQPRIHQAISHSTSHKAGHQSPLVVAKHQGQQRRPSGKAPNEGRNGCVFDHAWPMRKALVDDARLDQTVQMQTVRVPRVHSPACQPARDAGSIATLKHGSRIMSGMTKIPFTPGEASICHPGRRPGVHCRVCHPTNAKSLVTQALSPSPAGWLLHF